MERSIKIAGASTLSAAVVESIVKRVFESCKFQLTADSFSLDYAELKTLIERRFAWNGYESIKVGPFRALNRRTLLIYLLGGDGTVLYRVKVDRKSGSMRFSHAFSQSNGASLMADQPWQNHRLAGAGRAPIRADIELRRDPRDRRSTGPSVPYVRNISLPMTSGSADPTGQKPGTVYFLVGIGLIAVLMAVMSAITVLFASDPTHLLIRAVFAGVERG